MQKTLSAVEWVGGPNGYLKLIDQTKLPHKLIYLKCTTAEQVADAIKRLAVRGAPAIGVAAGFGLYLGVRSYRRLQEVTGGYKRLHEKFGEVYQMLLSTRPTAVNLKWALDRIAMALKNGETEELKNPKGPRSSNNKAGSSVFQFFSSLVYDEALKILKEDRETCQRIGENGAKLIKSGYHILTHCNAGLLATAGIGTALAPMYIAKRQGRRFEVFASETRPVLQGARLTVWELQRNHIPVTLICDNMVGSLMNSGRVDMVIVGADRIARNGDTANKIGTYQVALLAHHHRIPFYVAAPMSTFDRSIRTGKDIPIEFRSAEEVTHYSFLSFPRKRESMTSLDSPAFAGAAPAGVYPCVSRGWNDIRRIAPRHTKVYNPAFDVTPNKYITGFITDRGIITGEKIYGP